MLVLGRILERGIKNWPISRTGYQFWGKFFIERGANLESRAALTHPKNTQGPPPPPPGAIVSVRINEVSVLSELNLE